jgi:hypothetical protein
MTFTITKITLKTLKLKEKHKNPQKTKNIVKEPKITLKKTLNKRAKTLLVV